MKLDLQVRDLNTGERSPRTFESPEQAKRWLVERPKNLEVLGIASHHVPGEVSNELRLAMRPLDAEEKLLVAELAAAEEQAATKRAEERRQHELAEAARHRETQKHADPGRPMDLRYLYDRGLMLVDADDEREITALARDAAMAWVSERDEWVASRNQVVGDARIQVWPGELPAGKTERVVSGTFIPVSAPKRS
jgi:hypothetical protein